MSNQRSWSIVSSEFGMLLRFTDENGAVWWVPEDEANSDYQEYLEWLAEGNTPEVIES